MMSDEKFIEENKTVYNTIASHFSATREVLWDDLKDLKHFTKAGDAVLDVGCGNGRLYQMFADLSIRYTGVDQSEGLIEKARQKFREANFVVSSMVKLPFEDSSFDVLYSIAAFHHLPNDELRVQTLKEMKRVLKPGGKIIMTNWNAKSNWAVAKVEKGDWTMGEDPDHFIVPWKNSKKEVKGLRHYWLLTPEHLERLAADVGLKVEEQYYVSRGERVPLHRGMNLISIFS
jgi:ubiquinone/menaquinone biosynthesis C-methylase UbiE